MRIHLTREKFKPKTLLLEDSWRVHPPADVLVIRDGKIKVSCLPKNIFSKIQPLSQGIIATFEMHYRENLITWIVSEESGLAERFKKNDAQLSV